MAYGIQLQNDFGDEPLRSDGLLFVHSTGTMERTVARTNGYDELLMTALYQKHNSAANIASLCGPRTDGGATYSNLTDGGTYSTGATRNTAGAKAMMQVSNYATSQVTYYNGFFNSTTRCLRGHSSTQDQTYHWEGFVKVPSYGLHNWFTTYTTNGIFGTAAQDTGLQIYATPSSTGNNAALEYIIATNKLPSVNGENYGMQVKDASGNTYFDSRYNSKAIRVKDYISITASQFQDCLENGTTYNFTLRQAISGDLYVGGGPCYNVYNTISSSNRNYYMTTFKLTTSTNLQMYRTRYYYSPGSGNFGNPPDYGRYSDSLVTILDV